jgi:hypothetical protein
VDQELLTLSEHHTPRFNDVKRKIIFILVCFHPVPCVRNVANVSVLSIPDEHLLTDR